jgi:hypothetical protein
LFWCGQVALGLAGPRPQDQALAYLLDHSQPQQEVGCTETPWFADPPVDFCNGGAGIAGIPLWRAYQRPVRPVVVGPVGPAPGAAPPRWFVTTDFDLEAAVRAGDPTAAQELLTLARDYRATAWGGVPLALVPWPLGPDWRYPWPRIELWQHKQ